MPFDVVDVDVSDFTKEAMEKVRQSVYSYKEPNESSEAQKKENIERLRKFFISGK